MPIQMSVFIERRDETLPISVAFQFMQLTGKHL